MFQLPSVQLSRPWWALLAALLWAVSAHGAEFGVPQSAIPGAESPGFGPDSDEARFLRLSPEQRKKVLSQEVTEIRIAEQFGLGYLPLMLMQQLGLIEQFAREASLGDVHITWIRYPSGKAMNSALQLGMLDIASGGVPPLLRIWGSTVGSSQVKGLTPLAAMPMYLNVNSPRIKGLADFTNRDFIALPAVGESSQAIVLRMAAARQWGPKGDDKLDAFTVSMGHPQAMEALLSGQVSAHFASPPFQNQELADPKVHTVLDSFQVLGGPATFTVAWARVSFCDHNPNTCEVVVRALQEAMRLITEQGREAAQIYVLRSRTKLSVDDVLKVLEDPRISFGTPPHGIMKYARFMSSTGSLGRLPEDWREVFFPLPGG
jgi:NitT/TauT family transport system substrate-binding protein